MHLRVGSAQQQLAQHALAHVGPLLLGWAPLALGQFALTEQAVLVRNRKDAQLYLNRAKQFIGPNDPDWYRLQDLERATEDIEEPPARRR